LLVGMTNHNAIKGPPDPPPSWLKWTISTCQAHGCRIIIIIPPWVVAPYSPHPFTLTSPYPTYIPSSLPTYLALYLPTYLPSFPRGSWQVFSLAQLEELSIIISLFF
jgi:hypothetical protein